MSIVTATCATAHDTIDVSKFLEKKDETRSGPITIIGWVFKVEVVDEVYCLYVSGINDQEKYLIVAITGSVKQDYIETNIIKSDSNKLEFNIIPPIRIVADGMMIPSFKKRKFVWHLEEVTNIKILNY